MSTGDGDGCSLWNGHFDKTLDFHPRHGDTGDAIRITGNGALAHHDLRLG